MWTQTPTHFDLLVVMAVFGCVALSAFCVLGWMVWDMHRSSKESRERGERRIRALAGLVVQESEKIRQLMHD